MAQQRDTGGPSATLAPHALSPEANSDCTLENLSIFLLLHWTSCLGGGSRATGGGQSAAFRKRRFFPPWLGPTLHSDKSFIRQTSDKLHADKSYRQHIGEIARSRQPCTSAGAALAEVAGTRA